MGGAMGGHYEADVMGGRYGRGLWARLWAELWAETGYGRGTLLAGHRYGRNGTAP